MTTLIEMLPLATAEQVRLHDGMVQASDGNLVFLHDPAPGGMTLIRFYDKSRETLLGDEAGMAVLDDWFGDWSAAEPVELRAGVAVPGQRWLFRRTRSSDTVTYSSAPLRSVRAVHLEASHGLTVAPLPGDGLAGVLLVT